MKRKLVLIISIIIVFVVAIFLGIKLVSYNNKENNKSKEANNDKTNNQSQIDNDKQDTSNEEKDFSQCQTVEEKVEYQMKHLTLNEKIGQMLIVYYNGTEVNDSLKNTLKKNKPGGFILFSNNITTYNKTLTFINDIKATSEIPMFISIDQEGGTVQRLTSLQDVSATNIPAMSELGKKKDPSLAYDVGKVIAEELRVFGINMDFAPVLDVIGTNGSYIKSRSFGTDKQLVASMGVNLAKGLSDNFVIPVYKHFPGHGSTEEDSHYYLPVLKKSKEELLENDLVPFKEAINNGAEVIMIGHLAVPSITGNNTPASLSKEVITGLLKEELNFKGLVVTDALNMGALTKNYSEQEIYEMAINAGVDLLLMPKSSTSAIELINDSISKGTITEEQINKSVEKILTLKYEKLEKQNNLDKSYLGSEEHKKIINGIK